MRGGLLLQPTIPQCIPALTFLREINSPTPKPKWLRPSALVGLHTHHGPFCPHPSQFASLSYRSVSHLHRRSDSVDPPSAPASIRSPKSPTTNLHWGQQLRSTFPVNRDNGLDLANLKSGATAVALPRAPLTPASKL